jgi:rod shape-determining protein MreD
MRWIPYLVLAYLVIAVQIALSGFVYWGQASPNLVLPAVVFIAINARREEALFGAFGLGLLQDLFTQHPAGLYAFSYCLVGLFVVGAQPSVYKDHPLTHFFVTLLAACLVNIVVLFNDWTYPRLHPQADAQQISISLALMGALYTAALAPFLLFPVARAKRFFGFRSGRSGSPFAMGSRA